MALRMGVTLAEVDDVHQEVFVVVHRRLAEFEGRSSVRTWIFGILRKVILTQKRSFARKDAKHRTNDDFDPDALVAPGHEPEESASLREEVALARELIGLVDHDKRLLLILVLVEEFSVTEAALALDLNENTASSRLRAGRQQFSAAWDRHRARGRLRGGHPQ